jgi:RND family efflux transporter MFP subunit
MEEPTILQKNIEGLQADLSGAKAELEFSKKQLARYQELLNDHTVSARDTEQYQTAVHTQEQKVRSIQASIASQQSRRKESYANIGRDTATLQSASANLAYLTVRAPFSGNVGTLVAKEGDVVDPVSMLTTLTDNRNLEIEVAVSADDRHRIYMGMPMQLLTMRDESLGEVKTTYIAPNVDPMSQTFLLKAKVENTKNTLAMDQHLKVRLIWGNREALLVPVVSILRMDGMAFVYKAETKHQKDEKNKKGSDIQVARLQAVTLGPIFNDSVVVMNGLKPGDKVIQSGIQKLQEGASITVSRSPNGPNSQTMIEQE